MDQYHLAWWMGGGEYGPVRYVLIPADLDSWRGYLQLQTVGEQGQPLSPLHLAMQQVCACRAHSTVDGEESPQERVLLGTLQNSARDSGNTLPEILTIRHMPTWGEAFWTRSKSA